MRDYNYRTHHRDRVTKQRVINIPFAHGYYSFYSGIRRRKYIIKNPEDKWMNYLGEYCNLENGCVEGRMGYYGNNGKGWKDKYYTKRIKLKKEILKRINDEVGEKYYICSQ